MSRNLKTVKSNPLAGKIKKVMQTDDEVGKIAQGAPLLLGNLLLLLFVITATFQSDVLVQLGRWNYFWGNYVRAQQQ